MANQARNARSDGDRQVKIVNVPQDKAATAGRTQAERMGSAFRQHNMFDRTRGADQLQRDDKSDTARGPGRTRRNKEAMRGRKPRQRERQLASVAVDLLKREHQARMLPSPLFQQTCFEEALSDRTMKQRTRIPRQHRHRRAKRAHPPTKGMATPTAQPKTGPKRPPASAPQKQCRPGAASRVSAAIARQTDHAKTRRCEQAGRLPP